MTPRRLRAALWLLASLAWMCAACTHVTVGTPSRQGVVLVGLPPGALVYVDHKYWGSGAEVEGIPRQLSPGRHEILIVAAGFYPYYGLLQLKSGELVRRRPAMVPMQEGKRP